MSTEEGSRSATDVILVTGGSGFLGQHIVSQLQQRADYVKEIRVLDILPYKNKLGHEETKPVTHFLGSVTDLDLVRRACVGVHSVIHVAGLVSFGTFPNVIGMTKVNVEGTDTIIRVCEEASVQRLVFCSSVDVAIGFKNIVKGDEESTVTPKRFLFPGYPETKYRAERLVLSADGNLNEDGTELHSISLRSNVMYGEGDPYYVTNGLKAAKKAKGILYRVGNGKTLFQSAYVGNTAWAFLCADRSLKQTPSLGGRFFYIPDNTTQQNVFDFMVPYLATRGYRLSKYYLPYWLVYGLVYIAEVFLQLLSPLVKINLGSESCSIKYLNMTLCFHGTKAKKELNYLPLYSAKESMLRSIQYYKEVPLP